MTGGARVVLAGAGGMLGSAFRDHFRDAELVCLSREQLDVTRARELRERIVGLRPALVVNCAADTDVEGAEEAPLRAVAANALLPAVLAQACRQSSARLVHFSSTGCYGTWKEAPYVDHDPLRPTTAHHRAKAAGEGEVLAAGAEALILRLGWLFGGDTTQRKNFVWARIVEARKGGEMASDPFQTGNPSFVGDVVAQTGRLLDEGVSGVFNCVAKGATSRFDYVQRIVELAGLPVRLRPRRFRQGPRLAQ